MASFNPRDSANSVGSRHQLKRSLTELASPAKLSRNGNRKDRPSKDKDRYNDDRGTQLAPSLSHSHFLTHAHSHSHHPRRSSVDIMPRSEAVTPLISPDQSRRPSVMLAREEDAKPAAVVVPHEPPAGNVEELREVRGKTTAQVEGLKQSLVDMHGYSTATTSRLDETYYAVLEKMSTLQSTVVALKDLAQTARGTHEGFVRNSRALENDITAQVTALGDFKEQQEGIESLQSRIHDGRTKIKSLSHRVDVVRTRVERWERLDKESQEKSSRRLKTIWVFMSAVMVVMILLFFFGAESGTSVPLTIEQVASDEVTVDGLALNVDSPSSSVATESLLVSESAISEPVVIEPSLEPPGEIPEDISSGRPAGTQASESMVSQRQDDPAEKLKVFDEL